MNKKLGQGSAFPSWDMTFEENPNTHLFSAGTEHGMSKRFYAACAAMQGLYSMCSTKEMYETLKNGATNAGCDTIAKFVVQQAYFTADELLKQENE